MQKLFTQVNAGKSVEHFYKEFTIKDVLWTVARAWSDVMASTLKNCWHKEWPSLIFDDGPVSEEDADFERFCLFESKRTTNDIMDYAKSMMHQLAQKLD